jgi:hypothetical protein
MKSILFMLFVFFISNLNHASDSLSINAQDTLSTTHIMNNSNQFDINGKVGLFEKITVDRIIALISSLIAAITALYIFKTLQEMKIQRKNSQKPEIELMPRNYYATIDNEINITHGHLDVSDYFNTIKQKPSDVEISMFNLGFGYAKNIKIEWAFDFSGFTRLFSTVSNINIVRLPAYYPDLLCLFFKLSGELKASNGKFPYLKAICEYDDFEGTHYKKTFKLEHADSLGITDKQGIINIYYSYKVDEIT